MTRTFSSPAAVAGFAILGFFCLPAAVMANQPPDCSHAQASPDVIWPPRHSMVPVSIQGVTDPDGDEVTVTTVCIMQDEPVNANGDGNTFTDAEGVGSAQPGVRGERSGTGNGRVYHIDFVARDPLGAACVGSVTTSIPHSRKSEAVDGGRLYSSTPANLNCSGELPNKPPTATDQTITTQEDASVAVDLMLQDDDGDELSIRITNPPAHGSLAGDFPDLVYTPAGNFYGLDEFYYIASDGFAESAEARVSILVEPVNDAPAAYPSAASVEEDNVLILELQGTDVDSDSLTFTIVDLPRHGNLNLEGRVATYTPNPDYHGSDFFTYQVGDGELYSSVAKVDISVAPVNDVPVVISNPPLLASVGTQWQYQLIGTDADSTSLLWTFPSLPDGMFWSPVLETLFWTPESVQVEMHHIIVSVADGDGGQATQIFWVNVDHARNASPVILSSPPRKVRVGDGYLYAIHAVDQDDDYLSYSLVGSPHGMHISSTSGQISWRPSVDQSGMHPVTVRVTDSVGAQADQSWWITVEQDPDNRSPLVHSQPPVTAYSGLVYEYQLFAEDEDGDALHYALLAAPAGMHVSLNGLISWVPDRAEKANVVIQVSDGRGGFAHQSYAIDVTSDNAAPVIISTPRTHHTGNRVFTSSNRYRYRVVANDKEGEVISYSLRTAPSGVVINPESGLVAWDFGIGEVYELKLNGGHPKCIDTRYDIEIDDARQSGTGGAVLLGFRNRGGREYPGGDDIIVTVAMKGGTSAVQTGLLPPLASGQVHTIKMDADIHDIAARFHVRVTDKSGGDCHARSNFRSFSVIEAVAADIYGQEDRQIYVLSISDTNLPPRFLNRPPVYGSDIDGYRYDVLASDPEGNSFSIRRSSNTDGVSWNGQERVLYMTPETARNVSAGFEEADANCMSGSVLQDKRLSLSGWQEFRERGGHNGTARWVLDGDALGVTLEGNTDPSYFLGPEEVESGYYRFNVKASSQDDDTIGFVWGFQSPTNYYSFRWNGGGDCNGSCIRVSKVSGEGVPGVMPPQQFGQLLHTGNIDEWQAGVNYRFDVNIRPGMADIQIWNADTNSLVHAFSVKDDGYLSGRIGPYVSSQPGTRFTVERLDRVLMPDIVSTEIFYDDTGGAGNRLSVKLLNRGAVEVPAGTAVDVLARNNRGNVSAAFTHFPTAYTVGPLEAGESEVVYIGDLSIPSINSTYAIDVRVDPSNVIEECLENNNFVRYRAIHMHTQSGGEGADSQRYAITIKDISERPTFDDVPQQFAAAGRLYQFLPAVTDPDRQDRHDFKLLSGPDGASFVPTTGAILWRPRDEEIGSVVPVSMRVTDLSGHTDELSFDLAVHAVPVILSQPPYVAYADSTFTYDVEAIDPDGGAVSYHLVQSPAGASINENTGVLTWEGYASGTLARFIVAVRDDEGEETGQAFRVGVAPLNGSNRPPVIEPIDDLVVDNDLDVRIKEVNVSVSARDPDNHPLAFELSRAPAGMSIDPSTGGISWRPLATQLGEHLVRVRVYDFHGGEAQEDFHITITGTGSNQPPAFQGAIEPVLAVRDLLDIAVSATDPDGDPVSYQLIAGPSGLSINQSSGQLHWQPFEQHIGDHPLQIQAVDPAGASAILSATIRVLPANTTAPVVHSEPLVFAYIGQQYRYQIQAVDAEGDALHYELRQAPSGLAIDATGNITFFPTVEQIGVHQISIRVSDGRFDAYHTFPLQVIAAASNTPPLVLSQPDRDARIGGAYSYAIQALDAESDKIYYSLRSAPPGMTVDPLGVVRWQPQAWDLGVHDVTVLVADAQGAVVRHSWQLQTFDNGFPLITSKPVTGAVAGREYRYQVTAVDPEGDPLQFSLPVAPTGMTVDAEGLISWLPEQAALEEHLVTVRASDGYRYIDQTFPVYVDAQAAPLAVTLSGDRQYFRKGEQASIQATASGGQPPYLLEAWLDNNPVAVTGSGYIELEFAETGAYSLRVTVTDVLGEQSEAELRLAVNDGSDTTPPVVALNSPGWDQRITKSVAVTGTVEDAQLAEWSLWLRRPQSADSQLLASGVTQHEGVLGELDPTMLTNGLYELVLTATDYSGQTTSTGVTVLVEGNLKVGPFSFTLEDLSIPMAGIPVRVTRTYDSRRRHESLDFGHGWSVGYQDVLIDETSEPSQGWRQYQSYEVFTINGSSTVFRGTCTVPLFNKQVAVTLPDGKVERFDVRAEAIGGGVAASSNPDCALTASRYFNLVFVPDSQTHSQLQASGTESLYLANTSAGDLVVDVSETRGRDINRYTLTTREGYRYELDQSFGIRRVTDPNGHTLDYTDNGIFHSAGKSILFERDSLGRIVRITDPAGRQRHYGFNSLGDLITATDQAGHASTYSYHGRSHLLDEMQDPLGRRLLRNLYDDNGRLIAQEDNQGNRTDFNHDVAGRQSVVTDRRGNVSLFYYDDRGNVTSKVDAAGQLWQYTFDADDNPLTETNPLGERSESTFNEQGDQLTAQDALGNLTRFEYNTRGQETRIEDAKGNAFDNSYDSVGNLLSITDPQGNAASNEMLASGLVASTTDLAGQTTRYTYDTAGNKLTETDPLGNVSSWTYDANGNVLTESISRMHDGESRTETTAYEYDALNRVIAVTDALGNVTRTEYDAAGNEVAQVDALGRRTEMTYDAYGRVISTRYPDDTTTTRRYDAEGNPVEETDRLGRTTVMTYDALNRLTETRYPDGSTRTTEYDAAGRVIAEVDALGQRTRYEYDAAGRRTAVINALEQRHSFEYDANGNLVMETDANGHETRYTYNSLDQKVSTRFHDGSTVSDEYDALSRKTASVDQNGTRTEYDYDALGRLTAVRQFLNGAPLSTLYSYDSQGNKLTQTDAEGRTTSWKYDALGRVTARILPLGQRETFEYDANGNQIRHTDFNGQLTTSEYDVQNRLARRSYADGTQEAWTYDAAGRVIETTLTANGLPQVTHYQYDQQDRLTREAKPDGSVLEYSYDLNGTKTSVTVTPAGGSARTVNYSYDALNRLATATDEHGTTTYTYTPAGSRASVTQANGVTTRYSYDSLNRLTQLTSRASNGTVLQQFDYTLDATGHRTLIEEHNGRTSAYVYDDLYRLVQETITDPVNGNHSARYSYDTVGNRLESIVNGEITSYSYDANDRILSQGDTTYSYDANGNTLTESSSSGTTTYSWDARNRLIEASTPNGTLLFGYDIHGIRTSRSDGGITTNYVVDHNQQYAQVLAEIENGFTTKDYTYGDDLLSQTEGAGQERFFLYDGLGTTRALADGSEAVTDTYAYEAFGELLASAGSSDNSYRYTGEQYDSALDQYYLRARYYDQGVGRFSQEDVFDGFINQPLSRNRYIYALADPANGYDPSGYVTLQELNQASQDLAHMATQAGIRFGRGQVRLAWRTMQRMGKNAEKMVERIVKECIKPQKAIKKNARVSGSRRQIDLIAEVEGAVHYIEVKSKIPKRGSAALRRLKEQLLDAQGAGKRVQVVGGQRVSNEQLSEAIAYLTKAGVDGSAVDFFNGFVSFAQWGTEMYAEECFER